MDNKLKLRVNIGCGRTPTEDYINMDNTLAVKLANSSLFYNLMKFLRLLSTQQIENIEWNKKHKIKFVNATKNISLKNNSSECIYTSHMLEHLSRDGAKFFLLEAYRILNNDGVLRISVPDLKFHINQYLIEKDADKFMSGLCVEPPSILRFIEKFKLTIIGYRHHQWIYHSESLSKLIVASGFKDVTVCAPGKTTIKNPGKLNLYERSDESIYMEGKK
jgi:predicted SAM-dependent methyltransferase